MNEAIGAWRVSVTRYGARCAKSGVRRRSASRSANRPGEVRSDSAELGRPGDVPGAIRRLSVKAVPSRVLDARNNGAKGARRCANNGPVFGLDAPAPAPLGVIGTVLPLAVKLPVIHCDSAVLPCVAAIAASTPPAASAGQRRIYFNALPASILRAAIVESLYDAIISRSVDDASQRIRPAPSAGREPGDGAREAGGNAAALAPSRARRSRAFTFRTAVRGIGLDREGERLGAATGCEQANAWRAMGMGDIKTRSTCRRGNCSIMT